MASVLTAAALPADERDAFYARVGLYTRPPAGQLVPSAIGRLPVTDPLVRSIRAEIAAHKAKEVRS